MADDITSTTAPTPQPPTPAPQPDPNAHIFQPTNVHADVDTTAIPRENGWVQPNGQSGASLHPSAPAAPQVVLPPIPPEHPESTVTEPPSPQPMLAATDQVPPPPPSPSPTPIPEPTIPVQMPEAPEIPETPTAQTVATDSSAQADASAQTPAEPLTGDAPAGGAEKSPLEILEEILASASEEKAAKDKEEAEKKAQEEKEKAEMVAKEEQFRQEAEQKIAATAPALAQAKQQRADVDAQFGTATNDGLPEELQIQQLKHDKTQ